MTHATAGDALQKLQTLVQRLRDPQSGCPWDIAQTHDSMTEHLIEEAYEVLDAIQAQDPLALREELGDLLFQIVFHAQIAQEHQAFSLTDVIHGISQKMTARHPHVFGDAPAPESADEVLEAWEARKQKEGRRVLDGVPRALPALQRAQRVTAKAATVGFDWSHPEEVLLKADEELRELKDALSGGDPDEIEDELGDVLFVFANLARKLNLRAEDALSRTISKFEARFRFIEDHLLAQGSHPSDCSLEELDRLWNKAKSSLNPDDS